MYARLAAFNNDVTLAGAGRSAQHLKIVELRRLIQDIDGVSFDSWESNKAALVQEAHAKLSQCCALRWKTEAIRGGSWPPSEKYSDCLGSIPAHGTSRFCAACKAVGSQMYADALLGQARPGTHEFWQDDKAMTVARYGRGRFVLGTPCLELANDRQAKAGSLHAAVLQARADRDIVAAAVRYDGFSLKYASDALRGDRDIVLVAAQQSGWTPHGSWANAKSALLFASDTFRADRDVWLAAVRDKRAPFTPRHGNWSLEPEDRWPNPVDDASDEHAIVLEAMQKDGRLIKFASEAHLANHEIVTAAVRCHWRALDYASEALRADLELVILAMKNAPAPAAPEAIAHLLSTYMTEHGWGVAQASKAGFSPQQMEQAGFSPNGIVHLLADLKEGGMTASQASGAGYSPAQMAEVGYTPEDLGRLHATQKAGHWARLQHVSDELQAEALQAIDAARKEEAVAEAGEARAEAEEARANQRDRDRREQEALSYFAQNGTSLFKHRGRCSGCDMCVF